MSTTMLCSSVWTMQSVGLRVGDTVGTRPPNSSWTSCPRVAGQVTRRSGVSRTGRAVPAEAEISWRLVRGSSQASRCAEGYSTRSSPYTTASLAISAGVNVLALARMLGHTSAKVTLDTYANLFDSDLDA